MLSCLDLINHRSKDECIYFVHLELFALLYRIPKTQKSKKLYFLPPKITQKGAVPARYVTICYIPLPFTARYVTICYKVKLEWRRYVTKKIVVT